MTTAQARPSPPGTGASGLPVRWNPPVPITCSPRTSDGLADSLTGEFSKACPCGALYRCHSIPARGARARLLSASDQARNTDDPGRVTGTRVLDRHHTATGFLAFVAFSALLDVQAGLNLAALRRQIKVM